MTWLSELKIRTWIPAFFSFFLIVLIYAGLWYYLPDPAPRHLIFAGVVLLFLISMAWTQYLRRKTLQFSDAVCDTIEQLGRGEAEMPSVNVCDNGADTRIMETLYRYYEVMHDKQNDSIQAKQEIQEIISDISHQVKTPIANVKIYTNILRQHELDPKQKNEFFDLLDGQVEKLDFLLQSMIKMSRLETGIVKLDAVKCPVQDTVMQAMNVVLMKAEEKQIELSADCPPDLEAQHDPKWTAEALGNLLDNAVKYTPPGGTVSVRAQAWEYYVRIDITDTGIGIAKEHHHDIFKRFYRSEDVSREEGVGIGLYLSREIITYEKGYISVKSTPGQGTTFSVYLPA
ncbi:HAMP domain-containing histidine kinase [Faecalicatena sp. AGMB00832]|uniref:histidine kinase n=1 Tax=Faecalicatena faecalis TaxID=2726362 RepID=A0ABS6D7Y5_9FIRM|nr:HAMP domain-containing sensor histidine kinase [Faecalicatena faecalis]MBU3877241.1 HAMP domain-containing histidine kinase [Faecalicatena faecalis]